MKIVSKGKVLNSSEFYKKKQRRKRAMVALSSLGIILAVSLFVYLTRREEFQISEVVVSSESVVGREKIISAVNDLLAGKYLWVIPKSNTLFYPHSAIKQALYEKFPRFRSIDLDLKGLHTLSIDVVERAPFAIYCTSTLRPKEGSDCYFLDEDGLIFASAASFSDSVYFIYTLDDPIDKPLGKNILSIDEFKRLPKFVEDLASLNINPDGLAIGSDEYRLLLPNDGRILWGRTTDMSVVHNNLAAFLSDDAIKIQKDFMERVVYLDLRVADKVFYKLRD